MSLIRATEKEKECKVGRESRRARDVAQGMGSQIRGGRLPLCMWCVNKSVTRRVSLSPAAAASLLSTKGERESAVSRLLDWVATTAAAAVPATPPAATATCCLFVACQSHVLITRTRERERERERKSRERSFSSAARVGGRVTEWNGMRERMLDAPERETRQAARQTWIEVASSPLHVR